MEEDAEGFLYPEVDATACIDCGLCEKVCHELHPYEERKPLQVLAANNKDTDIRLKSSSGGIFTILAEKTLAEGGVVFGARFDENWQVTIDHSETTEGIAAFRCSKYVQARTASAYKDCERFLKAGRKVLYTGTPCQIAGLKHFLRRDYDGLTTVDFVCHGTPSPKVWGRYIDECIAAINKHLDAMRVSHKSEEGWKRLRLSLEYDERGKALKASSPMSENPYMQAFLQELILRPSCYYCKAKSNRSHSDITIADFWGVESHHPEIDDDKGTGLVMLNTEKGEAALDLAKVNYVESTYDKAAADNPAINSSVTCHPNRAKFFREIDSATDLTVHITKMLKPTLKQHLCGILRRSLSITYHTLKRILGRDKLPDTLLDDDIKVAQTKVSELPRHLHLSFSKSSVRHITFRDKTPGWKSYRMTITFH